MKDLLLNIGGDLYIDPATGDIEITDSVEQAIQIRLRWFIAEWWLGPGYGIPYWEEVLIEFDASQRRRFTNGSVVEFSLEGRLYENGDATATWTAKLVSGNIASFALHGFYVGLDARPGMVPAEEIVLTFTEPFGDLDDVKLLFYLDLSALGSEGFKIDGMLSASKHDPFIPISVIGEVSSVGVLEQLEEFTATFWDVSSGKDRLHIQFPEAGQYYSGSGSLFASLLPLFVPTHIIKNEVVQ